MARDVKTDREAMLGAALELIEESGAAALTARRIAAKLGISTQPIYREFGDMAALKDAALMRGYEVFAQEINGAALDQSAAYVRFASEHGRLFNFLFRERNVKYSGLDDMAHRLVEGTAIIDKLEAITGLPRERVYRLHMILWMALHGLAAMFADNELFVTDDEIKKMTMELTMALSAYYGRA